MVWPIVGWNLHVGKLNAFVKQDAKERLVFARDSFLCNPLRFLYGRALLPTPRRTQFPHFARQAESSAVLFSSPITNPPRKDFLRGFTTRPQAHPIPGKMDHGKLLCATAASKPKPTWFTHRILCPSRDFWRSLGQKLPPRDLPNPWKKAIQCVVAAQDAIPITVIAKKGLNLPWILSTAVVGLCTTSIFPLCRKECLLTRKKTFLAEGAPPALSIPSLIFRRIPSCRTSAPSPLSVRTEFTISCVGPRGDKIVCCTTKCKNI